MAHVNTTISKTVPPIECCFDGFYVYPRTCLCVIACGEDVGYGLKIGGVPVGGDTFVRVVLGAKVQAAMSKVEKIANMLRSQHLQSLHSALLYALSPTLDYWFQHSYPLDVAPFAQQFDAALLQVARWTMPGLRLDDDVTLDRLRLPARCYGGGIRSRVALIPAAFLGTVCRVAPRLVDSVDADGMRRVFCAVLKLLSATTHSMLVWSGHASRFDLLGHEARH